MPDPNDEWEKKKARIQAFEQLHELDVEKALKDQARNYKSSKGPFTKQGEWINYHEWHSFIIGGALIDFAFRLQEGAFLYFYLFLAYKVFKDCSRANGGPRGVLTEIETNFHYYIAAGLLASVLWMETGASPPTVSFGMVENLLALVG